MSDIQAYMNVAGTPYAKVVLVDLSGNPYVTGGGGGGATRAVIPTVYIAVNAFTGASVGDTITHTQFVDITATPSTFASIWRNQTTATDLASAPSQGDIELVGSGDAAALAPATDVETEETGAFTIAAGALAYSVINTGAANGIFNGISYAPGNGPSGPPLFGGRPYPALSGDATGTTFLVQRIGV